MIGTLRKTDATKTARSRAKSPPGRRLRRQGRGTLMIVALMLVGSAGLRATETWGIATAFEGTQAPTEEADDTAPPVAAPNYEEIIAALDAREARIAERETLIDTRAQALALAEERLDEKIARLEAAEADLQATMALSETAAETDLAQLTSVYENMGAEEAALLFGQMTPDFAAGFLGRMRPDIAAAILSGLDPLAAYEISVILAGRNALAPRE